MYGVTRCELCLAYSVFRTIDSMAIIKHTTAIHASSKGEPAFTSHIMQHHNTVHNEGDVTCYACGAMTHDLAAHLRYDHTTCWHADGCSEARDFVGLSLFCKEHGYK